MLRHTYGDALISACGRYRTQLRRWWDVPVTSWCLWIMLNPSTADGQTDDATISDICARTHRWSIPDYSLRGYPARPKGRTDAHVYHRPFGGLIVGNLYAWRETDPFHMWAAQVEGEDIIGPDTDRQLRLQIAIADTVICAWGNGPSQRTWRESHLLRARAVVDMIRECKREPLMLNVGKSGHPRHPLYWPADAQLSPFIGYAEEGNIRQ